MSLKLRKVNAEVRDPESEEMIPAGLLGSDALSTIEQAKDDAIEAVEDKGAETLASIPDDYSALSGSVGELKTHIGIENYYDEIDNTAYQSHGGNDYRFYVVQKTIKQNFSCKIGLYAYANCTFYIGLVGINSLEVKYINSESFVSGKNEITISNTYDEDCYIMLDGGNDKILFSGTGDLSYRYTTPATTYPSIGDTLAYSTQATTAGFRISIELYPEVMDIINDLKEDIAGVQSEIDGIRDDISDIENDISDIENDIDDIKGFYKSMEFSYDENASSIATFLLNQKIPANGIITKLRFRSGANQNNVKVDIYEWDGATVSQALTIKRYQVINVVNGVADVNIPVYKDEYIGISNNSTNVCSWDNNANGAGFLYTPTTNPVLYANKYITLSYELYEESGIDYLNQQFKLHSFDTKPLENKIVFLAGDSRSSDDYTFYGTTIEEKTGCIALVQGRSGWTAAQIASNSYFTRLTSNPHDFSIWLVGGNDTGTSGSVGTFSAESPLAEMGESVVSETDISQDYNGTTFIQAIDHMMRKYVSLFYNFKTLNNGHKPKMIFCTDLPQKRSGGANSWSNPLSWERKRLAILECCEKNNIACLDLLKLCNFNMSYEPEWTSPTDKVNDNGLYFMDGLHPNQYGIDVITSLEIAEMKKYITVNPFPAT